MIAALMHYDFLRLYPINPKSLARYREAFSSSGAKDDPNDAALLLDLLVKHRDRFSPWIPDDALSRQLALRVEHRRQLVDLKTSLTHQLSSQLKLYSPKRWTGLGSWKACKPVISSALAHASSRAEVPDHAAREVLHPP